jgi:hypothetical protein
MPHRYTRRRDRPVVAVRIALDTDGLAYRKWGAEQRAKPGDWIVDNNGDVYTVDAEVFGRTYRQTGPGTYIKTAVVWAEPATDAGSVATKEGRTHYEPGDYIVSNSADGSDRYAMDAETFNSLYERDTSGDT